MNKRNRMMNNLKILVSEVFFTLFFGFFFFMRPVVHGRALKL